MATWNMINFQDPNSPYAEVLINFYNLTMIILCCIVIVTFYIMMFILKNKYLNLCFLKDHNIEIFWTITPMFMLILISMPSLHALYFIDELWNPVFFTIKAIGHQWYWVYQYPEFNNLNLSSYIIYDHSVSLNFFRSLDVDNRLVIPFCTPIRLLTTSVDVIHSWTVPSLGIKMDAVPGRINQMTLLANRPGLYFGQCSEICGAYHSFMPIAVEVVNINTFLDYLSSLSN